MNARVNWVGYKTIVRKEVTRILRIWAQTVVPPAITMTLYFIIGSRLEELLHQGLALLEIGSRSTFERTRW